MELEPKAKPVRIRIMSGGEEHSSLESLKKNFSVDDLSDAVEDKRLSRWLKQQNQNELAEGVLRYQGKMKSLSYHDYLGFIKLFFANEPNIKTVTDDCSLAAFFHDNDKWKKNFERVFNRCCESKGFTAIHYFYRTYKDEKTTDSWIKHFEGLKDGLEPKDMANCLSELAILYGERNMPIKKIRSLCSAIALGSKDAERELQNMTKSDFGVGANALNSPKDWLNLLEKYQRNVSVSKKCEFLRALSTAYKSMGDLYGAESFLLESAEMGDKESAEKLFQIADFRKVKSFYERCGSQDLYSLNEWLAFFNIIKNKIREEDKKEYYFCLAKLAKKQQDNDLYRICMDELMRMGVKFGNEIRRGIDPAKTNYQKLSKILNDDIIKYDEHSLARAENHLRKENDNYLILCADYISVILKCINGKAKTDFSSVHICGAFKKIETSNSFPYSRLLLHWFLLGLCCEFISGGNNKNYYRIDDSEKLGFYRRNYCYNCLVSTDNGFSCTFPKQINKQSFIQMTLFAMETCGSTYSCKTIS